MIREHWQWDVTVHGENIISIRNSIQIMAQMIEVGTFGTLSPKFFLLLCSRIALL
jgi:hypothetical protein